MTELSADLSDFAQKLQDITMQAKQRQFNSVIATEIDRIKSQIESAMLCRADAGYTYLDICIHNVDAKIDNKTEGVLFIVPSNTGVSPATLTAKLIEWFRYKHKLYAYMSEYACRVSWDFKRSYLQQSFDWLLSFTSWGSKPDAPVALR